MAAIREEGLVNEHSYLIGEAYAHIPEENSPVALETLLGAVGLAAGAYNETH